MTLLSVRSHKGVTKVDFCPPFFYLRNGLLHNEFLIIDRQVASSHRSILSAVLGSPSVFFLDALEINKTMATVSHLAQELIRKGARRQQSLIAVGGGITQDLVSFLAGVLYRGVAWKFYPTTLTAQADSCIGSKSSINVGEFKNQIGLFNPPQAVFISVELLQTLSPLQFCAGLGEVIKAHLIGGEEDFYWIAENDRRLREDPRCLAQAVQRSLEVKKELVEKDEFDRGERRLLNYGHSFGHAIESATGFAMPHGIAVRIGIDMANFISWQTKLLSQDLFEKIHDLLWIDRSLFPEAAFSQDIFWDALKKDKKNIDEDLFLILTQGPGRVFGKQVACNTYFRSLCLDYFQKVAGYPFTL